MKRDKIIKQFHVVENLYKVLVYFPLGIYIVFINSVNHIWYGKKGFERHEKTIVLNEKKSLFDVYILRVGVVVITGSHATPDDILNFVPHSNLV